MKWIPRKAYWALKKAGKLPVNLKTTKVTKTKRVRRKRRRKLKKSARTNKGFNKKSKVLKSFIVYLCGEEQTDRIQAYSAFSAEKKAQKLYNSKSIFVSKETN